jgi:hypothetical protein
MRRRSSHSSASIGGRALKLDLNTLLYIVVGAALFAFVVMLIILQIVNRRARRGASSAERFLQDLQPGKSKRTKQWLMTIYQKSYVLSTRLPLLEGYVYRIRKRLSNIHSYDELTMRKETMKIALTTWSVLLVSVVILLFINHEPSFLLMIVIAVVVVNGMLVDTFVSRVEDRLLKQLSHLMTDVRHHYHQHGMVEEAIYEAAQGAKFEASLHGEKIYDILTSNDPEEELENYYEVAPNRFLKGFAGISFLTKEYGDKVIAHGSLYLNSLNRLTGEINFEILRREKLNYLFKGLTSIALAPIFFTKPVENWARDHFPSMNDFYTGKWGFLTKMLIFVVILVTYVLLRKMMENDEGKYAAKASRPKWEKKAYENLAWVRWLVDRFVPGSHTRKYFRQSTVLKETNSPLTLEWLYLQRIVLSVVCFVAVVIGFVYMHHVQTSNVLYAPTKSQTIFGSMSPEEAKKAQQITDFDRGIIQQLEAAGDISAEQVAQAVKAAEKEGTDQKLLNIESQRIAAKIEELDREYFKWWELLAAVGSAVLGYYAPLFILWFQQRLREMDMQHEVDQFHAIIAMLCEIERISVENILEWMERFAMVFKAPLQICLLNYEAGAEKSLDELKESVTFLPFGRTIDRLLLAVDKIPIRQAFDDLETERNFYQEQRREKYERTLAEKSAWGKMIGFVPMYALVFLYLVIPLIYMSMTQMTTYFTQLQNIQ